MASIFTKGDIYYINYYDPEIGKARTKSTGLKVNKDNKIKAQKFADSFQKIIDLKKARNNQLSIKTNKIGTAIEHFLRINSKKNTKTIEGYKWFFKKFTVDFPPEKNCSIIHKRSCEDWLIKLRHITFKKGNDNSENSKCYSRNSLHGLNKILKKFLNFLFEYSYIPLFKLNRDVVHGPEVKPILVFDDADMKIIKDSLHKKNSNFQTMFYLLHFTGLRPSDLIDIKTSDISLDELTIDIYSRKTKQYRKIPITSELQSILTQRIKEVGDDKLIQFNNINNMGKAFRRFLEQIKLDERGYTLRTFRKAFITYMHSKGADLATVSKLVGHNQINTTAKYYNLLSIEKQREELNKVFKR